MFPASVACDDQGAVLSFSLSSVRCYMFCFASAVHPQINPSSRNLQRSVQQLHAWDARRKMTVSVDCWELLCCTIAVQQTPGVEGLKHSIGHADATYERAAGHCCN